MPAGSAKKRLSIHSSASTLADCVLQATLAEEEVIDAPPEKEESNTSDSLAPNPPPLADKMREEPVLRGILDRFSANALCKLLASTFHYFVSCCLVSEVPSTEAAAAFIAQTSFSDFSSILRLPMS